MVMVEDNCIQLLILTCFPKDRVDSDKAADLHVPAYQAISEAAGGSESLSYVERFRFYDLAKTCFCIIQTTDSTPYANIIIGKGVIS